MRCDKPLNHITCVIVDQADERSKAEKAHWKEMQSANSVNKDGQVHHFEFGDVNCVGSYDGSRIVSGGKMLTSAGGGSLLLVPIDFDSLKNNHEKGQNTLIITL
jgi:hypothetical protein